MTTPDFDKEADKFMELIDIARADESYSALIRESFILYLHMAYNQSRVDRLALGDNR